MLHILHLLNWLLPVIYLALLLDYGMAFFLKAKPRGRKACLPAALGLHLLFLVLLGLHLHRPIPQRNSEVLSILALSVAAVYTLVEHATRERRTGMFMFLAVFLFQYTSSLFLFQPAPERTGEPLSPLHTLPALVAYTAFTISAVLAALHLLAQRNLKRRQVGVFFDRLPPLELLGRMSWNALLVGFVFISLAIATGAVAAARARAAGAAFEGMDMKVLAKIVAGTAAWVIYAAAILGRYVGKWSAARISAIALYGFLAVMLLLVASIILSPTT